MTENSNKNKISSKNINISKEESIDKKTKIEQKKEQKINTQKQSISKLSVLAICLSCLAVGASGYTAYKASQSKNNSGQIQILQQQVKQISKNQTGVNTLQVQAEKLTTNINQLNKTTQNTSNKVQDNIINLTDLTRQSKNLSYESKQLSMEIAKNQNQIAILSTKLSSPVNSIYLQSNLMSIQSAIYYLNLAKDVIVFTGNTNKANLLINMVFHKLENAQGVNLSASDKQELQQQINNYTYVNALKQFVNIQAKIKLLKYNTISNLLKPKKEIKDKKQNQVLNYLSSLVTIQDLPSQKKIIQTNKAQLLVSNNLYNTVINIQNALYTSNTKILEKDKSTLIKLIKEYFVLDKNSKTLVKDIQSLKIANNSKIITAFDNLISKLSKEQKSLIEQQQILNK